MSIKCFINCTFTVDVVAELAGLMQVNNMGDEEVENVVTSLTPLNLISELPTWKTKCIYVWNWLTVTGRSHGTSPAGRSRYLLDREGEDQNLFGHWSLEVHLPPAIRPMLLNHTRMNLPNREELSFLTVLALPYASSTGLVCTTWSSREAFFFSPSFGFFPAMDSS